MDFKQGRVQVKSRKEKRKEACSAKRQKHLHQWALKQAGKLRRGEILLQEGKSASQVGRDCASSSSSKNGTGKSEMGKKRSSKNGSAKSGMGKKRSRTSFEEYLEMERKQTQADCLEMERILVKKLKVKNGKLRDNSDGLFDLLDGIGSALDYAHDGAVAAGADDDDEFSGRLGKRKVFGRSEAIAPKKKELEVIDVKPDLSEDSGDVVPHDDMTGESDEERSEGSTGEDQLTDDCEEEVPQGLNMEDNGKEGLELPEGSAEYDALSDRFNDRHRSDSEDETGKDADRTVAKYVPPHLRSSGVKRSEEMIRLQRRVRGLLNRMSEANVESIVSDLTSMFQAHGRKIMGEFITEEIISAFCGGPRGNEQFAAVSAAFIAGIAAVIGIDVGAKFLASLAIAYEEQYKKGDGLALRNLSLLFSNLFIFHFVPSELVYDLLGALCKRFEELDVATILCLLQSCGFLLRGEDPAAMKEFILSVQSRTADLKAAFLEEKAPLGKRVEFMLDTICDIKNNKRRQKEDPAHHARLKKWLKKLRVEDVQLRAVTWTKLLDPEKKGQWWLGGADGEDLHRSDVRAEVAGAMGIGSGEADRMLQLAALQRMNTDARRAIFCVVMSSEDYMDAFEKLLRLKLPGKQDREVVRVIVDCCLQEKIFNKYYALLACKLCHHDKNHKFSLQYCLWDQFKQLESMEIRRISNLARLVAELLGSFGLSMSVLKSVDFTDAKTLTPKVVMHFSIVFRVLLMEYPEAVVWAAFSRIAAAPELASLRDGITLFLHQYVTVLDSRQDELSTDKTLLPKRCRFAKKALSNVVGLLLQ